MSGEQHTSPGESLQGLVAMAIEFGVASLAQCDKIRRVVVGFIEINVMNVQFLASLPARFPAHLTAIPISHAHQFTKSLSKCGAVWKNISTIIPFGILLSRPPALVQFRQTLFSGKRMAFAVKTVSLSSHATRLQFCGYGLGDMFWRLWLAFQSLADSLGMFRCILKTKPRYTGGSFTLWTMALGILSSREAFTKRRNQRSATTPTGNERTSAQLGHLSFNIETTAFAPLLQLCHPVHNPIVSHISMSGKVG